MMHGTLSKCVGLCLMLVLAGCATPRSYTATEICAVWEESLFRPSRADTHETAVGLTQMYKDQEAACSNSW